MEFDSLFSGTEVTVRRFGFLRLVGNILYTATANLQFTLFGTPSFVSGPTGAKALLLNGNDQFVDMGDQTAQCIGNLDNCKLGLTVKFNLKVIKFSKKMYIFSNGGDDRDSYGMAMWYERKRLFLSISTSSQIWTVKTKFTRLNQFTSIRFSWSVQLGIRLYFDGVQVAKREKYYKRKVKNLFKKFYLGCSIKRDYFSNIVIEGWDVAEAVTDVVKELDVKFGKSQKIVHEWKCNLSNS